MSGDANGEGRSAGAVATIELSHPSLHLVPTIRRREGEPLRLATGATDATSRPRLFVHAAAEEWDSLRTLLEADSTVAAMSRIGRVDGEELFRTTPSEACVPAFGYVVDVDGYLLDARSAGEGWRLTVHVPGREALDDLVDTCEAAGISFTLRRLSHPDEVTVGGVASLTAAQREALVTAYDAGYFEEPRRTGLEGLGHEMGLSSGAVAGRLRRAVRTLVESAVAGERRGTPGDDDGRQG